MKPILLLAEGDTDLRDIYRGFFLKHDYEVVVAANGLDCLHQLIETNPDLLVLDQELLWGGGDGVLAWLREEQARPGVPVILTATAGCSLGGEENEPPVVQCLPKPFTLTALLERVRAVLARKKQVESVQPTWTVGCSEMFIG